MPGAPPPLPTSTIGPAQPATSGTARSESSSRTRRASAPPSEVSPGVARTASSQWSSSGGEDDDVPIRLRPLARGLDARDVLQPLVNRLPLHRCHRLERDPLAQLRAL